ncbi:hypothetical protein Ahy_A03g011341 [Arachis hypogaea]|uniref:Uncharacterized protein n=1 Tax=Arachis hypogaea TaxID=3818 RepID=A0A445DQF0_ARAHY|nr:hypothetical protein Ahy_A03g011341 [Arachis hypogaea]
MFFLMVVMNYKASSTQGCWCLPYSVLLICLKVIQGVPYSHQIGSGVGLVGLCLSHVKASKVILSDGDLSTLANMKFNLELNHLNIETEMSQGSEDPSMRNLHTLMGCAFTYFSLGAERWRHGGSGSSRRLSRMNGGWKEGEKRETNGSNGVRKGRRREKRGRRRSPVLMVADGGAVVRR